MLRLNPYAAVLKRAAILTAKKRQEQKDLALAEKRGIKLPKTTPAVKSKLLRARRAKQLLKLKEEKNQRPVGFKGRPIMKPTARIISRRIQRAIAKTDPEQKDTLFKTL
ncbi:uncharacterized protein [Bombus fervidus]|uniref:uncharacterized protein n=1 Tax=Bombus fervidus TaxID=203811 RepID=UPI003D18C1BD